MSSSSSDAVISNSCESPTAIFGSDSGEKDSIVGSVLFEEEILIVNGLLVAVNDLSVAVIVTSFAPVNVELGIIVIDVEEV